jgi:hypothetical protein
MKEQLLALVEQVELLHATALVDGPAELATALANLAMEAQWVYHEAGKYE